MFDALEYTETAQHDCIQPKRERDTITHQAIHRATSNRDGDTFFFMMTMSCDPAACMVISMPSMSARFYRRSRTVGLEVGRYQAFCHGSNVCFAIKEHDL